MESVYRGYENWSNRGAGFGRAPEAVFNAQLGGYVFDLAEEYGLAGLECLKGEGLRRCNHGEGLSGGLRRLMKKISRKVLRPAGRIIKKAGPAAVLTFGIGGNLAGKLFGRGFTRTIGGKIVSKGLLGRFPTKGWSTAQHKAAKLARQAQSLQAASGGSALLTTPGLLNPSVGIPTELLSTSPGAVGGSIASQAARASTAQALKAGEAVGSFTQTAVASQAAAATQEAAAALSQLSAKQAASVTAATGFTTPELKVATPTPTTTAPKPPATPKVTTPAGGNLLTTMAQGLLMNALGIKGAGVPSSTFNIPGGTTEVVAPGSTAAGGEAAAPGAAAPGAAPGVTPSFLSQVGAPTAAVGVAALVLIAWFGYDFLFAPKKRRKGK